MTACFRPTLRLDSASILGEADIGPPSKMRETRA
jgi:hypothetical protein